MIDEEGEDSAIIGTDIVLVITETTFCHNVVNVFSFIADRFSSFRSIFSNPVLILCDKILRKAFSCSSSGPVFRSDDFTLTAWGSR